MYLIPIVLAGGTLYSTVKTLPLKVHAQGIELKKVIDKVSENTHKHDLATQERGQFKEALSEIKRLIKDIRDHQIADLRRKHRNNRGN